MIKGVFEKEKIEYFSSLPYAMCRILREDMMARESFLPRSVIVFLIPYYGGETVNISRYAASYDYHLYAKELFSRLIPELKRLFPENSFKGYCDSSPIDERHAAALSGLGDIGESGLLINECYGSYVFIAEIICDVDPCQISLPRLTSPKLCDACGACLAACPTGRLSDKSLTCLSDITQRKGEHTENEIEIMRKCNTVWGCDLCQISCPHNASPTLTPIDFFHENRIVELNSDIISEMDKYEFSKRAYSWRGRKTLLRNLKYFK
jgi:epoxyqueuosine reductase